MSIDQTKPEMTQEELLAKALDNTTQAHFCRVGKAARELFLLVCDALYIPQLSSALERFLDAYGGNPGQVATSRHFSQKENVTPPCGVAKEQDGVKCPKCGGWDCSISGLGKFPDSIWFISCSKCRYLEKFEYKDRGRVMRKWKLWT